MTAAVPDPADAEKAARERCAYGHTKADHDAAGACARPSLDARTVAAVHYPDPISALRIAFERGWDAALAAVRPSPDSEANRHEATRLLIARAEGAAGALNAASHEVDNDEDAQLLVRRAMQWEREVERYRAALGTGDGWIATTETCARCAEQASAALGTGDREGGR